jgi:hypothetical protein
MEELLAAHFERLEPVKDYPWFVYDVYVRRTTAPARESAATK